MTGVMLTDDLIFFSRVSATARAHGHVVKQARTVDELLRRIAEDQATAAILDLHNETLDLPALLATLGSTVRTIGYGSHVDAALLRAAREAGCGVVMPRSQFVAKLETNLPQWLQS